MPRRRNSQKEVYELPLCEAGTFVPKGTTRIHSWGDVGLTVASSLYEILAGSVLTRTGSSKFYPANNSAVMANSSRDLYGLSSGFLRTMANIGMLGSFAIAISIASISVPRYVAFKVFAGALNSLGSVSASFMSGIHALLLVAFVILAIAAVLSLSRGGETRSDQH